MKYLGYISLFFESKGYGFIRSEELVSELGGKDLFFHVSDCSFLPKRDNMVIFQLKKSKDKIKAICIKRLAEEIEFLIAGWDNYSDFRKRNIFYSLNKDFQNDTYIRNYLMGLSNNLTSTDVKLQGWLSSISERVHIADSVYVENCKKIIDEFVCNFLCEHYAEFDFNWSNDIPSDDELNRKMLEFLQDEKPLLHYTHTEEDGYWYTQWKWDGSEDRFRSGSDSSLFESKNSFVLKKVFVDFSYSKKGCGCYDEDLKSKNDVVLTIYSLLKNKRYIWKKIVDARDRRFADLINDMSANISKSLQSVVLNNLQQYLSEFLPIYGKNIYKILEPIFCKQITGWDIDKLELPWIPGVDYKVLREQIRELHRYIHQSAKLQIEQRCYRNFDDLKTKVINEVDGMRLSSDKSVLYEITNSRVEQIVIPESVICIEDGAFASCPYLKRIEFLGKIEHIGNEVFCNNKPEIIGDFPKLSFFGYNTTTANMTINNETRTIKEWSYQYNKDIIENTEMTIKRIHIKHEDE